MPECPLRCKNRWKVFTPNYVQKESPMNDVIELLFPGGRWGIYFTSLRRVRDFPRYPLISLYSLGVPGSLASHRHMMSVAVFDALSSSSDKITCFKWKFNILLASQRPTSHRPIKVDGDVGRWWMEYRGLIVEVISIINIIIFKYNNILI